MPDQRPGRALAPDLARGVMLMLIAVANIPWHLWGWERAGSLSHPADGSPLDRAAQALTMIVVDQRVYPMFAFLFGYGMVQFVASREARGVPLRGARRMLRKRHWMLLLFGFLHAALLFEGDILGAYGATALVLVWLFFARRDRTVAIWAGVVAGLLLLVFVMSMVGLVYLLSVPAETLTAGYESHPASGVESYPASIVARLTSWVFVLVIQVVNPVIPLCILLGWLAARHRVLEEPGRHLTLLRRTTVAGLLLGLVGGTLNALNHLGVFGLPDELWWAAYQVANITGLFGGLGYVALFGLLAHRLAGRQSLGLDLAQAVGKRSLSCYLAQSVVFASVFAAWGLRVGGWMGSAAALVVACLTWLIIGLGALWLERRGRPGPAETLLRRVMNGRQAAPGLR